MIEQAKAVAQRLRWVHTDIALMKDFTDAANTIDALVAEVEQLKDNHERLKKMVDDGSVNGRMYTAGLESEKEIDLLRAEVERLKDAAEGSPLSEEAMDIAQSEIRRLTGQAFLIAVERDELRMEVKRLKQEQAETYDKTELNAFVQDLYDKKMREGKHGHYETMFHVVHQAIKRVSAPKQEQAEPVGVAGEMPVTYGCFTFVAFKAADVPAGTKLYTALPDHAALLRQALEALEEALETMKSDWQHIDSEFGPTEGGLEAAIDGRATGYDYFQKTITAITAIKEALK